MQKIISWNVASVRARLPVLMALLEQEKPDIVLLQEIKSTEETFPFFDLQLAGYRSIISGQKSYNGVAILSKLPISDPVYNLPGFDDQARFIQANIGDITFISVYVPNGNPPEKDPSDTSRLHYKLDWFQALKQKIDSLLAQGKRLVIGGDFNVIERDTDVYNPELFRGSALMVSEVKEAYQKLQNSGLSNMIRQFFSDSHTYTFWDFQGGAWPKNNGILLDAFLVCNQVKSLVTQAKIYRDVRGWAGSSDHVPIGLMLADL